MVKMLFIREVGNGAYDARDDYSTFMDGDVIGVYMLEKEMSVDVILNDVVEVVK